MRRFMIKRKISPLHLLIASILGLTGGVYIWKPIFESKFKVENAESKEPNSDAH